MFTQVLLSFLLSPTIKNMQSVDPWPHDLCCGHPLLLRDELNETRSHCVDVTNKVPLKVSHESKSFHVSVWMSNNWTVKIYLTDFSGGRTHLHTLSVCVCAHSSNTSYMTCSSFTYSPSFNTYPVAVQPVRFSSSREPGLWITKGPHRYKHVCVCVWGCVSECL